jgi:hypothetical protein
MYKYSALLQCTASRVQPRCPKQQHLALLLPVLLSSTVDLVSPRGLDAYHLTSTAALVTLILQEHHTLPGLGLLLSWQLGRSAREHVHGGGVCGHTQPAQADRVRACSHNRAE